MINYIKNKIQNIFRKNSSASFVGILVSGTALAQAIPILISPILTRIYSPDQFGFFATYMSCVSILTIIATANYEMAITLPKKDNDARHILIFTLKFCLFVSTILFIPIYFFGEKVAIQLGDADFSNLIYLLPVSVLSMGVFNIFRFWYNRKSQYQNMSINQIQLAFSTAIFNISFGMANLNFGLVMGRTIGQVTVLLSILFNIFQDQKNFFYKSTFKEQLSLAKRYIDLPKYNAPAQLIGVISQQIPIFLIGNLFSIYTLGFFSIAMQLISIPTFLVAKAIGDVYRQKISVAYNLRGEFKHEFLSTLKITSLISIPPFLLLYFFAPEIFSIIYGEEWRIAGKYAQIIVISSFFQFIFTPIDKGALVVGKTSYILIWHILRLLGFVFLFFFASIYNITIETVLWLHVFINLSLYLIDGVMEFKFASKKN